MMMMMELMFSRCEGFVAKVTATIEKKSAAELIRDWQAGQKSIRKTRKKPPFVSSVG